MSFKKIYVNSFLVVCALLATSYYFQYFDGMQPCPLCTLQRFSFTLLGGVLFLGIFLHNRYYLRLIINDLAVLASGIGAFFAGRQVWIQNFQPAGSNECGVSLEYMLKVLHWQEVMQKVFAGSAECAAKGWTFLSLTMAEWTFAWFTGFFLLSVYLLIKGLKR